MTEDDVFFRRAAEAIVATSLNVSNVDPTIRELLKRITVNNDIDIFNIKQNEPIKEQIIKEEQYLSNEDDSDVSYITKNSQRLESLITATSSSQERMMDNASVLLDFSTDSNKSSNDPQNSIRKNDHLEFQTDLFQVPKRLNDINKFELLNGAKSVDQQESDSRPWKKVKSLKDGHYSGKEYPCNKCHLIFGRSSDLRRHEKAHLPILPNICSQCGKGFARKDALRRHFDTLTCKRNRSKLLSIGEGSLNQIIRGNDRQ